MKGFELEICAGDAASVEAAAASGADRVEICCALPLGGLTPPASSLLLSERWEGKIARHVLLRPRPGDFLYSELEMRCMEADLRQEAFRRADGYVLGVLDVDGNVDRGRTACLMGAAGGGARSFTFHRAFDMTADPLQALEDVIELGFHRILTSGCAATAELGIPMLRRLVEQAAGRITIMAGGGVNAGNVRKIMELTGVRSFHASCSALVGSAMQFRNHGATMAAGSTEEYSWISTSRERVAELRESIDKL